MWQPKVLDLSHHNTVAPDFSEAYAAGIQGIIHKATEGRKGVDAKYKARRFLAQRAGMLWGAYHFFRPGNVFDQVDWFLNSAEPDEQTLLVLDHEDENVSADDALQFLQHIERRVGRMPVLYSGHVIKEQLDGRINRQFGRYRLWLAQYGDAAPEVNPSWSAPWLWQFTESGKMGGLGGAVDINKYAGSDEQLAQEWAGNPDGAIA